MYVCVCVCVCECVYVCVCVSVCMGACAKQLAYEQNMYNMLHMNTLV